MKKEIKRCFQIIGGIILILAGLVMLVTPGQGILSIVAGVFLISPYHGRRLVWRIKRGWKRLKCWWFSWQFKRVIKRKVLKKARALRKKICKKK